MSPSNIDLLDTRNLRAEKHSWPLVKAMCGRHATRTKVVMGRTFKLPMSPREFFKVWEVRCCAMVAVADRHGRGGGDDKTEQVVGTLHAGNPAAQLSATSSPLLAAVTPVAASSGSPPSSPSLQQRQAAEAAAPPACDAPACGIRGGVSHSARVDERGTTFILGFQTTPFRPQPAAPPQELFVQQQLRLKEQQKAAAEAAKKQQRSGRAAKALKKKAKPESDRRRKKREVAEAAAADKKKQLAALALRPAEGHVLHDVARALGAALFDGCPLQSEEELECALEITHALVAAGSESAGADGASGNRGVGVDLRATPRLSPSTASLLRYHPSLRNAWAVAVQLQGYAAAYAQVGGAGRGTGAAQWHLALLRQALEALSVEHAEAAENEEGEEEEEKAEEQQEAANASAGAKAAERPTLRGGTALPRGSRHFTQRHPSL